MWTAYGVCSPELGVGTGVNYNFGSGFAYNAGNGYGGLTSPSGGGAIFGGFRPQQSLVNQFTFKVRIISLDGQGNLTDRTSNSGPKVDLKKYSSNRGFHQLPRDFSKSSLDEALGEYSDLFWRTFTRGDGQLMTDKPFKAIRSYIMDQPYQDITFRFRFNAVFEGHKYNVVLNAYYGN